MPADGHRACRRTACSGWYKCLHGVLLSGIEDHAVFPLLATRMDVGKQQEDHAEMDTIIANIEQASSGSPIGKRLTWLDCAGHRLDGTQLSSSEAPCAWSATGMRVKGWRGATGRLEATARARATTYAVGGTMHNPSEVTGSRLHGKGDQPHGMSQARFVFGGLLLELRGLWSQMASLAGGTK
jgi:hypothetical protein